VSGPVASGGGILGAELKLCFHFNLLGANSAKRPRPLASLFVEFRALLGRASDFPYPLGRI
jgi:hypothetical protein